MFVLPKSRSIAALLAVTLLVKTATVSTSTTCSRINAAFNFDLNMYFIIGDNLVSVDANNNVNIDNMQVSELEYPHEITAAVGLNYYREFYLVSGSSDQGFVGIGGPTTGQAIISNADLDSAFSDEEDYHGIDAAVHGPDNDIFYFSGCSYVLINPDDPSQVGRSRLNHKIGLPCNVDAAVYQPLTGVPIVIKDDAIWLMDLATSVFRGPLRLTNYFPGLGGFQLCPFKH